MGGKLLDYNWFDSNATRLKDLSMVGLNLVVKRSNVRLKNHRKILTHYFNDNRYLDNRSKFKVR